MIDKYDPESVTKQANLDCIERMEKVAGLLRDMGYLGHVESISLAMSRIHSLTDSYLSACSENDEFRRSDVGRLKAENESLQDELSDSVPKHVAWDHSCKTPPKVQAELAALKAEVRKLREALEPFAKAANEVGFVIHDQPGNLSVCDATSGAELVRMSTTDFFAARQALEGTQP